MPAPTLKIDKSADRRTVKLTFTADDESVEMLITAEELSTIIAHLGDARTLLVPPVPTAHYDAPIQNPVRLNAAIPAERIQGGRQLLFRHPGFGWLAFEMSGDDGTSLIAGISAVMHADRIRSTP